MPDFKEVIDQIPTSKKKQWNQMHETNGWIGPQLSVRWCKCMVSYALEALADALDVPANVRWRCSRPDENGAQCDDQTLLDHP